MSDPFLGEIRMVGFNFAPNGWAFCAGQILPIAQNTALFSLLGTTYGGNGQTTFALPDLRGRVPVNQGQGPGLSNYDMGEQTGTETVTLLTSQMPIHTHLVNANGSPGNSTSPTSSSVWAASSSRDSIYTTNAPNTNLSPNAIGGAGGNQPHNNLQPLLCVNFIIALQGIYPSRG